VKVLSIRQPWAWLIVNGYKDIENRTWATLWRGPLLIHASRTIDQNGIAWTLQHFPEIALPERYETGGIVGVVSLMNIVRTSTSPWFLGPYGFLMGHARPLPFLRMHGQLSIFTASPVAVAWLEHHGDRPPAP
jgi:hypothetical protein